MSLSNEKQQQIKILDYTYTSEPSINIALPLRLNKLKFIIYVIFCIFTFGFVWLLARWSSKRKVLFMYSVCRIEQADYFLITEEDVMGGNTIIPRTDRVDVKRRTSAPSFCYHERNYSYHEEKQVFLPIRYEDLGMQLDRIKKGKFEPYSQRSRKKLLQYYGLNQIKLSAQNQFQVFIEEMLTPYQVFQLYAILLWIYEEYYIFSVMLLAYSLYTYWDSSKEVVKNQKILAERSYFNCFCKVFVKDKFQNNQNQAQSQANDSEDYTIVEEVKSHSEQIAGKRQFNLSQEIQQKNTNFESERQGNFPTQKTVHIQQMQSNKILPGDVIILKEGDVVPCDCLIICGEALVDESYISGQNFLLRKTHLQNYEYSKDKEKGFLIYLGTKIIRVKSYNGLKRADEFDKKPFCLNTPESLKDLLQAKQIACLVTQTNYNTQRGKYLRAIRYQKKSTDNFTRQTIYFIYIILFITAVIYLALLPITFQGQQKWDIFIMFLDLLATSIPITLPTALSVGINFAQHRLAKNNIHSIMPSNILSGGRATTLVMDSSSVLGKNYQVSSIVVGVKGNKNIGNTYSSLDDFLDLTNSSKFSQSFYADPEKKKMQINKMHENGKMLIRAFATCHSLQKYNNQISGSFQQRHLFQFSNSKLVDEDIYQCLNQTLIIKQRVYFREKDKKLGVIVQLQKMAKQFYEASSQMKEIDEEFQIDKSLTKKQSESQKQRIAFIKGPTEKIMKLCKEQTRPLNYHDYVVDLAEKGFKTICFAYKKLSEISQSLKNIQDFKQNYTFCGFALLQISRHQDTIQTIAQLKQSKMQLILMSEQRQLQTSSVAINNRLCTKNQLILCGIHQGKVKCSGHMQWQSNGDDINEFIMQSESFTKNSYLSLNSRLYQQLFMKKDDNWCENIFKKTMIFNEMQNRHARNVYFQLQKRNRVTFAVGSGGSMSQCANLSMQLERGECSMLSSFHTNQKSMKCITKCLIICRAALATNFHCFSMMILFSLVQFTTIVNLYFRYQNMNDSQYLYEDLFVTFPIFITINMTLPVDKLSSQLPPTSFFSGRALASMIGQFAIQLTTQIVFISYLSSLTIFQYDLESAHLSYVKDGQFLTTNLTLATFVLTNYLYLGIVLSTSVSKPFRKPFYTNPYYTLTLVILWCYNTAIVLFPEIVPQFIRPKELSQEIEQILVLAMLSGNLIMIVMYLYENLLVWITALITKIKNRKNTKTQFSLQMV